MPGPLPEFRPTTMLARLVAGGVDFVIVGGYAMVVHGSAAITRDLDICYSADQPNLDRLGATLLDLGAGLSGVAEDVPFVPDGRTLRRTQILTLVTSAGRLDLLRAPEGAPEYERLAERALQVDLDGIHFKVASLEDLIAMKRAAGRPKDLLAVEELEAIQRILREEA